MKVLWICYCPESLAKLETNADLVHLEVSQRCPDCSATMAERFEPDAEPPIETHSNCTDCHLQIMWNEEAFREEARRRAKALT